MKIFKAQLNLGFTPICQDLTKLIFSEKSKKNNKKRLTNLLTPVTSRILLDKAEKSNINNNLRKLGLLASYVPSTFSIHNNIHSYQNVEFGDEKYFCKFDYGEEENLKR